MKTLNNDNTYYGFFRVFSTDGSNIDERIGGHCSQKVYISGVPGGKIKFYYPNDWLTGFAKSKPFLDWFCKIASEMFDEVKYIGKFESFQIDIDLQKINASFGYEYENKNGKLVLSQASYIKNKGDLIVNDLWRGFEINVGPKIRTNTWLAYSSYSLVRYLFASHYQEVASTFVYLIRNKLALNLGDWSNFELLQISHYWSTPEFPSGARGFFNRENGQIKDSTSTVFKLRTLKEFKDALYTKTGNMGLAFNESFGDIKSKVTVGEINTALLNKQLYKFYESLK